MSNIKSALSLKNSPSTPWKVLSFDLLVWFLVSTVYWINNVNLKISLLWLFFGLILGALTFIPVLSMLSTYAECEEHQIKLVYSKRWIFCLMLFNGFLILSLFYLSDFHFLLFTELLPPLGL